MSPKAQSIAIAQACGWRRCRIGFGFGVNHTAPVGLPPGREIFQSLPKYLTDLNAMHEAEKLFDTIELKAIREYLPDPKVYNTYIDILRDVVGGVPGCYAHVTATAAQRAEAFLKTIGKWVESTPNKG